MMEAINEFYDDEKNLKLYKTIDVEYFKKNYFCARYHLDNKWSRAKVLKECGADKVRTLYIRLIIKLYFIFCLIYNKKRFTFNLLTMVIKRQ